jgi:3-deoxy-manno-octulosonate cytidylyltransferase (CMP-KDO synthetase)
MIEHVYRRAAACPTVSRVIVGTDDQRVAEAVQGFGGEARLTRPDHPSGMDRLAELVEVLDCDLVVNVQGDEPLIDPEAIGLAVEPFRTDPSILMTTLCHRLDDSGELADPNVVKVVLDRDGCALYFSRAAIPFVRDPAAGRPVFYQHIGVYVYRRSTLVRLARLEPTPLERAESLEQLRALEHGIRIRAVETPYEGLGVDTPADLDRARRLLAASLT